MKRDYTTLKIFLVYLLGIIVLIGASSCGPQRPDYVNDGREYSISSRCVKSHTETEFTYHYGYDFMAGKYRWHWGNETKTICDSFVMDTTEINIEKKYYTKK